MKGKKLPPNIDENAEEGDVSDEDSADEMEDDCKLMNGDVCAASVSMEPLPVRVFLTSCSPLFSLSSLLTSSRWLLLKWKVGYLQRSQLSCVISIHPVSEADSF